jgi:tetraacyldisaccharide 4'-kinase
MRPTASGAHPNLESPPVPRSPWQLAYAAAHRWRAHRWRRRARRLPVAVVSVGNLHWGGAGKTPVVAALAAHLRDRGLPAAVLARGYRGRARGPCLVSRGEGTLVGPEIAGDEPVMLAEELRGVAVVVGRDRFRAGAWALRALAPAPRILLLDDGFSHLALARDLDLLVFPAADPFAGGRLLPSGRLREPLSAAARADAALLTGALEAAGGPELARALRPFGFRGPGFASRTALDEPRSRGGGQLPAAPLLLVAGIARPERFFAAAEAAGWAGPETARLVFPDHHAYPASSLERIRRAAAAAGAVAVLTTAKDEVKLGARLALPLWVLPARAEPEAGFWSWLDQRLDELDSRRGPERERAAR